MGFECLGPPKSWQQSTTRGASRIEISTPLLWCSLFSPWELVTLSLRRSGRHLQDPYTLDEILFHTVVLTPVSLPCYTLSHINVSNFGQVPALLMVIPHTDWSPLVHFFGQCNGDLEDEERRGKFNHGLRWPYCSTWRQEIRARSQMRWRIRTVRPPFPPKRVKALMKVDKKNPTHLFVWASTLNSHRENTQISL